MTGSPAPLRVSWGHVGIPFPNPRLDVNVRQTALHDLYFPTRENLPSRVEMRKERVLVNEIDREGLVTSFCIPTG